MNIKTKEMIIGAIILRILNTPYNCIFTEKKFKKNGKNIYIGLSFRIQA